MQRVFCSVAERFVNPLFEVFDGGDFILSSWRDIEKPLAEVGIYFENASDSEAARAALKAALDIVGVDAAIESEQIADEDWRFAYRRHFTTERISPRLAIHPPWEPMPEGGGVVVTLDPGMAFGTGKHETTRACLEFIDELAPQGGTMIDMGCGSGILSIAASLLGYTRVAGFDVDPEAVKASIENASLNSADVEYYRYALGSTAPDPKCRKYSLVVANILAPLLIRYADEILLYVEEKLVVSGILTTLYDEVLAAYSARGLKECAKKTYGEWTSALLTR